MKNILVSGAHGLIGYGIIRSIKMSKTPYNIIGISIYEDSVAPGFCDTVLKAPMTFSEEYIPWLLKTIQAFNIDILFPGFEDDVTVWNENVKVLKRAGAEVVLNDHELITLCDDKWNFYEVLRKHNNPFSIPSSLSTDFDELTNKFGLPLLLKPRKGSASKGILIIRDKNAFNLHKKRIGPELLVQPFIGNEDEEYTTSAFCDGNGGFHAAMTLKRKLSKQGYTEKASVFEDKKIKEAVLSLCKIFKPIGPTNFQFRYHDGMYRLLEINPRISSATSIRSSFGYNEGEMAVHYYLENTIPKQPTIKKGKAVRYIEDFIFAE